ncbi:YncE family protein [Namhaeicola litoreus]|uniref:YncE family protein n=1 Tax=Namhaeicola litoreus TaxID=1052145 RepID=A0ABW3XZN0_9FLAO
MKLAFFAVLFMAFSCNEDMAELEANQDAVQAKNSKAVLKTIARGAEIHGTNGIYFGPDDNLYIASFYGQEIVVMDKQNGKILKRFPVNSADDLVFHPDGESFYFTDILTGFVTRMDLEGGEIKSQYVAPGVNPITFLEDEDNPENLRLFVGLDFEGDGLYELDPNLIDDPRPIVEYAEDTYPIGFSKLLATDILTKIVIYKYIIEVNKFVIPFSKKSRDT